MSVWCFSSEDVHQWDWSYCSRTGAPSCQNKHQTLLHHRPQCFMCNLNSISRRGAAEEEVFFCNSAQRRWELCHKSQKKNRTENAEKLHLNFAANSPVGQRGRGDSGHFSHFRIYFQKIQNKENKFMYTNTSKIEYVLYKICTAVRRVETICSVCL